VNVGSGVRVGVAVGRSPPILIEQPTISNVTRANRTISQMARLRIFLSYQNDSGVFKTS
jgi:hypothetical protein